MVKNTKYGTRQIYFTILTFTHAVRCQANLTSGLYSELVWFIK